MTRFNLILACIVFAVVPWPALAATGQYSISAEQVAASVNRMGVQIAPGQVTILADVVAARPSPALQVRSLERLDADRFMARLECVNTADCVPFMASIQVDKNGATQLASISSRQSPQGQRILGIGPQPGPESIVIRSGAPAMLQLEGDHVQIRIPVICLQSGAAGQTIRATDKDHRRIYAAQVVSNGLLRGRL